MEQAERSVSLDAARGAVLLHIVVILHPAFFLALVPQRFASLLLFEMPAIFLLSGISFHFYAQRDCPRMFLTNAIDKALRILPPFLVYATALLLWYLLVSDPHPLDLGSVLSAIGDFLNPFSYGRTRFDSPLTWSLWFIAPYLLVSLALPLIHRLTRGRNIPLLAIWLCGLLGMSAMQHLNSVPHLVQETIHYGFWATLGLVLAKSRRQPAWQLFVAFSASLTYLVFIALDADPATTVNMQTNKSPPNAIFYAFAWVWISPMIWLATIQRTRLTALTSIPRILRPFCAYGLSIYLWQGIGFTAALSLGTRFGLPRLALHPIAVLLTLALARIAAPIERLRPRRKRVALS